MLFELVDVTEYVITKRTLEEIEIEMLVEMPQYKVQLLSLDLSVAEHAFIGPGLSVVDDVG